jgi:hypothetical protein
MIVPAYPAVVSFVLSPADGLLVGGAGTSVGWGFTISTDSDFVTIQNITFGDLTPIGVFSTPGLPSTVASVGSDITTPWIQDIAGLQYDIDISAIPPASTFGFMMLTYDTFSDSDLQNQIGFGDAAFAAFQGDAVIAEVDVNAAAPSLAPEPGTLALLGSAIAAGLLTRLRRNARR